MSYVDAQIGKLLDALRQLGIYDNTLVVVWGDHGWHLGDHLIWGKHTIFDRALCSALIIKTPGKQNKGIVCNQIVSTLDIYPTILDVLDIAMPHPTDGRSMTGLLYRESSVNWHNAAYSYFRQGISLRTERFRLTKYFREEEPTLELYDHKTDPYENSNVAAEFPAQVEKLMQLLEKGDTGLYR